MFASRSLLFLIYLLALYSSHGNPLVIPLLPFISQEFQLQIHEMGLLITLFALPGCLIPFFGVLEDRIGRRAMLLTCVAGSMVSAACVGLAPSFGWVLAGRFIHGIFTTPLEALVFTIVADHFIQADRTRIISRVTTLLYFGVAVTPLLSTAIQYLLGWRPAFFFPAVLGIPLILLALRGFPDPVQEKRAEAGTSGLLKEYSADVFQALRTRPVFLPILIRMLISTGMFGIVYLFLPTLVTDKAGLSPHMVGLCYVISSAGMSSGSYAAGRLLMRISAVWIALGCGLTFVLGLLAMLGDGPASWLFPGLFLCGWTYGILTSVVAVFFANATTLHTRGALMAINSMMFRAAQAGGVTLMGMVFTFGGTAGVLMAGLMVALLFSGLSMLAFSGRGQTVPHH